MLEIQGDTNLFLVVGDPIAHSLSPRMHNAAYAALGLRYVMVACRVTVESLVDALHGVRALNVRGLACTMPHKKALCSLIDVVDPVARHIGAINTVVNQDGVLTGYNTDWLGIQRPLEKQISLKDRRIAIIGAGGAAQAALYACTMRGASVVIFNRNEQKASALAALWSVSSQTLNVNSPLRDFDIIINTTPVGMGELENESLISPNQLRNNQIVFETIYHPPRTKLLQYAEAAGCKIIYGHEMFLEQGAAQFELHTGAAAPRDAMAAALHIPQTSNE
jgi:shikimate dehydrogenase